MLPFLKPKQSTGLIIAQRKPDVEEKDESTNSYSMALNYCAEDLLDAIENKDIKAIAAALKAAHELCSDAEDLDTDESSISKHTYEDQNIEAAKERE